MSVSIKAENGSDPSFPFIGKENTVKYKAVINKSEIEGTFKWTVEPVSNLSIIGSDDTEIVEIKGDNVSNNADDCQLSVEYTLEGTRVTDTISLTVIQPVIKDKAGTNDPPVFIGKDNTQKYKCIIVPQIDKSTYTFAYNWTTGGSKSSVAGSNTNEVAEIKGDAPSEAIEDSEIKCQFSLNEQIMDTMVPVTVLHFQYLEDESEIFRVWDVKLVEAPEKVTAVFKVDIDPGSLETKGKLVDEDGNEVMDLTSSLSQSGKNFTIEWDGKDSSKNKIDSGIYKIKLIASSNGEIIGETESEEIKIIRIGITEISFIDNIRIKFCNNNTQSIFHTQWKIDGLDDSKGNPKKEPPISRDQKSSDDNNYSYPVCYTKQGKVKFSLKIAGKKFGRDDEIRVTVNAYTDSENKFRGSNNHQLNIASSPEFTAGDNNLLPDHLTRIDNYNIDFYFSYKHTYNNKDNNKEDEWKNLGKQLTTKHTIYVILNTPVAPWVEEEPWIRVLEKVCNGWAKGKTNEVEAINAITIELFNSGFKYTGSSKYIFGDELDLIAVLNFLANKTAVLTHKGDQINCSDCATIVTSLANAVGCELWSSKFGNFFDCHKVIIIGSTHWEFIGFWFHEVAWSGNCGTEDRIWDACLKVAEDPGSSIALSDIFVLNMRYSDYEPLLVLPEDLEDTSPSGVGIRRPVTISATNEAVWEYNA